MLGVNPLCFILPQDRQLRRAAPGGPHQGQRHRGCGRGGLLQHQVSIIIRAVKETETKRRFVYSSNHHVIPGTP